MQCRYLFWCPSCELPQLQIVRVETCNANRFEQIVSIKLSGPLYQGNIWQKIYDNRQDFGILGGNLVVISIMKLTQRWFQWRPSPSILENGSKMSKNMSHRHNDIIPEIKLMQPGWKSGNNNVNNWKALSNFESTWRFQVKMSNPADLTPLVKYWIQIEFEIRFSDCVVIPCSPKTSNSSNKLELIAIFQTGSRDSESPVKLVEK